MLFSFHFLSRFTLNLSKFNLNSVYSAHEVGLNVFKSCLFWKVLKQKNVFSDLFVLSNQVGLLLALVMSSTKVEHNYQLKLYDIKSLESSELKCVLLKAQNISLHQERTSGMSFTSFKIRNTVIS